MEKEYTPEEISSLSEQRQANQERWENQSAENSMRDEASNDDAEFDKARDERVEKMNKLRSEMHHQSEIDLARRMIENPNPTEVELRMHTFIEAVEPQVREALLLMYKKGYTGQSSGFWGENHSDQALLGSFTLDEDTVKKLEAIGVRIDNRFAHMDKATIIRFTPPNAKIEEIKAKWMQIAELLPDKGHMAPPVIGEEYDDFERNYFSKRKDLKIERIKHTLSMTDLAPEYQEKMRAQLEELEKEV